MSKGKVLQPTLRFSGFDDNWKFTNIADVVDVRSGRDYKHLNKGYIPVYGTGGYMLSVDKALSYNEDAIGIGRKGTIDRPFILNAPFWTVDTLFYAVPRQNNDLQFAYSLFQKVNWKDKDESTGVPSLSKVAINSIPVFCCSLSEQAQIGKFFQHIDQQLKLHQSKYTKLQQLKKAMLGKMLPKAGEKVPEVRFAGFSGDWEEKYLGNIGNFTSGIGFPETEQGGKSGVPYFKVSDLNLKENQYSMTTANNYVSNEQIKRLNYKLIKENSILFAKVGAAIFLERKRIAQNFLMDNNMMAFSTSLDITFIKQWFDNIRLSTFSQVGALPSFNASDLAKIVIRFPNGDEQKKIGEYFHNLDRLIALQQQHIDKLKNIKQACLEKMFV
ncbi:type I restriction-modification [Xenorhabdus beddingii]|uniref:Type I restriction-modification n=1 Tax=Xenorhabdus beddingii TaxID=40578 RepID=A0A1Y2SLG6_9GAMM|nr:restriction endonuclease subunit S [Xenorhabdus beddingii]OTA19378.1 type I restriction-modification [Xenorhabdus beddingii]